MQPKLSIIMPCYNCASTLEESVGSIYTQNLEVPFEVVMVNDASTDNTWEIMRKLLKKYKEIKLFKHVENLGGGAARNTAVQESVGDVIFCLDGDDILPSGILERMYECLIENQLDGVVFEESRFFSSSIKVYSGNGKKLKRYEKGGVVGFSDLFDTERAGYLTQVNFLFTRKSFLKTGGYPTHHGFDTQGFGFKYLARGNRVMVCPDTYYFHRQNYKKKSYFDRVYEAGEYSKNMYLIYEEIFFLFSPRIRKLILSYDIFENNKLGEDNLGDSLVAQYRENPKDFFVEGYERFLNPSGFSEYVEQHIKDDSAEEAACRQVLYYLNGKYAESFDEIKKILQAGFFSKVIAYNLYRTSLGLSNKYPTRQLEAMALNELQEFALKKRQMHKFPGFVVKLGSKLPGLKSKAKSIFRINN